MSRICILLLGFVLSFGIVFTGCKSDNSKKAKTNNKNQKKTSKKSGDSKKTNSKVAKLPLLKDLTASKKSTKSALTTINKKKVEAGKTNATTGKNLFLQGWAVDEAAKKPAAGVYAVIGDKTFKAAYGKESKAIGTKLKNKAYNNAGFNFNIPVEKVGKGKKTVQLKIVAKDKKSVYSGPSYTIEIK